MFKTQTDSTESMASNSNQSIAQANNDSLSQRIATFGSYDNFLIGTFDEATYLGSQVPNLYRICEYSPPNDHSDLSMQFGFFKQERQDVYEALVSKWQNKTFDPESATDQRLCARLHNFLDWIKTRPKQVFLDLDQDDAVCKILADGGTDLKMTQPWALFQDCSDIWFELKEYYVDDDADDDELKDGDYHSPAQDDDIIWGAEGMLHGLAITKRADPAKKVTLVVDKKVGGHQDADHVGHNGNEPGDWYPYQVATNYHGAHGHRQWGVYGDLDYGAYSVMLTKAGMKINEDLGDEFWYPGPEANDDEPILQIKAISESSHGTRCLQKSYESRNTANPHKIRVIRGSGSSDSWAPKHGFRYDGLYQITDRQPGERQKKVNKVFITLKYWKYKFERLDTSIDLQQLKKDCDTELKTKPQWIKALEKGWNGLSSYTPADPQPEEQPASTA